MSSAPALAVLTVEQLEALLERAAARGAERALASRGSGGDVLSTDQAADVAGVSAKTIRAWISEGLPAGRRGRLRTILRPDLERWLAGEREPNRAGAILRGVG